jgi:glycosyltransferase involved in cell wall biosynthesis
VYTERVLRFLVSGGHDVTWYSATHRGEMPSEADGIHFVYGGAGLGVYPTGHVWLRHQHAHYDVVVDQINVFGFAAPMAMRGTPYVAFIHQLAGDVWDWECPPFVSAIGKRLERLGLRVYRDAAFATVSESTMSDLRAIGWRGPGRIVAVGLDTPPARDKSEAPSIVFLGRFEAKAKRLDHALAVYRHVRAVVPEAEFWVIGRGPVPSWLPSGDGVRVYNNISDEQRDELLARAWCCVATSVREGWGRMVMESAAAGTPAVAYRVHGLRDTVLDGRTGVLVPPDPQRAADAVIGLFRDPERLRRYASAARANAATMTWASEGCAFEDLLLQASEHFRATNHGVHSASLQPSDATPQARTHG